MNSNLLLSGAVIWTVGCTLAEPRAFMRGPEPVRNCTLTARSTEPRCIPGVYILLESTTEERAGDRWLLAFGVDYEPGVISDLGLVWSLSLNRNPFRAFGYWT
jgi:hypothetical protein